MVYLLILTAVVLRLVPHVPNFAPVAALALFGGAYLKKKWAIILPILAMLISDYFIGFYSWKVMLSVYLSFVLVGLIGLLVRRHKTLLTVIGGTLAGSVLFYLITNFAVWAFGAMYPHNFGGLIASYVAAIPFFRGTLLGDFFYVGLLFGSYELVLAYSQKRAKATV